MVGIHLPAGHGMNSVGKNLATGSCIKGGGCRHRKDTRDAKCQKEVVSHISACY